MRTLVILRYLIPLGISFRRDRRRWLFVGAPLSRTSEFDRRRAERILGAIVRLGPTFVKLAQVFAGRADLIPEPYVSILSSLTDSVPPVPYPEIERTITETYGAPPSVFFEEFEVTPIAAASLGQVHRARYQGQEVAVKVLRPGVEELVAADVSAALRILEAIERFYPHPHVRAMRGIVTEFASRIGDEMDFRKEAANAEEIRGNFAGNRRVVVPRMLRGLARQHVLVMEFMTGTKIDALGPEIAAGRLRIDSLLANIMELYLQMMLVDGFFHADPHPGNILVKRDGTVVLLDFGMVVRVPRETRWNLVNTVFAAVKKDAPGVLAGFRQLGIIAPGAESSLQPLATELLDMAYERKTATERIEHLLAHDVLATLYDWPTELPSEMVYFARTAALIEGLGVRYDARFNPIAFASPIAMRMRNRIVASLRDENGAIPEPLDWATWVGRAAGQVAAAIARTGEWVIGAMLSEAGA
jgi:predicted unusual protein kinase regulating ubiquinone biosynthesis (AarF/ABC1/UbiB family)